MGLKQIVKKLNAGLRKKTYLDLEQGRLIAYTLNLKRLTLTR